MEADSPGGRAAQCAHGLRRCDSRSRQSADCLCSALRRQRTPWSFTSGPNATGGEDVGGIFKSTNGGATWKKLSGGLPGQTGRTGLAVSASNPKIVMAVVQSFEGGSGTLSDLRSKSDGVFRSVDNGEHSTRMSAIDL